MRRAAKVDETQAAIVMALRQVGASVWVIGLPVDLLVGFRGKNYLIECKSDLKRVKKPRKGPLTVLQAAFIAEWAGDKPYIVSTPQEALRAIGAMDVSKDAVFDVAANVVRLVEAITERKQKHTITLMEVIGTTLRNRVTDAPTRHVFADDIHGPEC